MILRDQVEEYVRACFSGIWIESHEHQDAIAELAALCRQEEWDIAIWDIDQGLCAPIGAQLEAEVSDPLAAVKALGSLGVPENPSILVLQNFHRFLNSPEIVQAVTRAVMEGKANRKFVMVLAPVVKLPVELEKLFVVVEHQLPDKQQLEEIARGIATEEGELPEAADLNALLDAAAGLTRFEAEGAFSLSLVRHDRLQPDTIWELKSGMLKKSGLLNLHRGTGEEFDQLGGLDALKAFCRRALRGTVADTRVRARGVMLLGLPGVGKSAFCKALGRETNRPTLTLDIGAVMGSLVGQTESNIRQALAIADAMSPCILFVDEVEKALSGSSGGSHDSGVASRLFGTLLTWMNDHTSDVFLVATCNDVSKLPPEFSRAERFDGVFFLDLPSREQRDAIWEIHAEQFGLATGQRRPKDDQWTGAEIKACCRLSALLDVPLTEAAHNIVPIAVTAGDAIEQLRSWADGRCLSADHSGVFRHGGSKSKRRRNVSIKPSAN